MTVAEPGHEPSTEDLLRAFAPQVLGSLLRRGAPFDAAEDAVQEALVAASQQWQTQGVPRNPRGWLVSVARRRLTDELRSVSAAKRREIDLANRGPADVLVAPSPADDSLSPGDDTLTLLFLCCHPALSAPSQLALTLRAVGGLTTAEIARAFFVPEATMGQRISRAKQRIREAGSRFVLPTGDERRARLAVVLHALYLLFNEGYTTSAGTDLVRADLTIEAIRLTRAVRHTLPDDGEVQGLLALMLLNDTRRAARTAPDGSLVPLAEQDRSLWDTAAIEKAWPSSPTRWPALDWGRTNCRPRSPRCTPRHRRRRKPTGRRSCASTNCCRALRRTPWSRSTTRSRSQLPKAPTPDSTYSPLSMPTSGSPRITGSRRCGRTCSRWPVIRPRRESSTAWRLAVRRAAQSSIISKRTRARCDS